MKTTFPLILAMALNGLADIPQVIEGERGAHHRVWHRIVTETNEAGGVSTRTNQAYIEMATGMHYLDKGLWLESKEQFELVNGAAVARQGQHQVILLGNIAEENAVDLLTPDDKRFQSNPRYLSFYDAATKKNVLIAEVKESVGQLIAPNVVLYNDCFDTIQGAIRFTYTRSAFEQDIILYENPGNPADHGLNPATTLIEIYTEFHTAPQPRKSSRRVASGLEDETLDFEAMQIGRGKAFALLDEGVADEVGVAKLWTAIENRQFLVESAPYLEMKPLLDPLPARQEAKVNGGKDRDVQQARTKVHAGRAGLVAALARARTDRKQAARKPAVQIAARKETITRPAVVIDYITLNASSQTNYIYKGDTTYYINGSVNLSGTTTFEGGTVIKFSPTNSPTLTFNGPSVWQGAMYRPSVFTARDDNSVGQTISGSTGNPNTNYYGNPMLKVNYDPSPLKYLRLSYAQKAIQINFYTPDQVVEHAQFVKCQYGLYNSGDDDAAFKLRNVLFYKVLYVCSGNHTYCYGEHVTVNDASTFYDVVSLTNSLIISVTNHSITGLSNAVLSSSSGVLQTVGAASHYLADNSPYRNSGTTNIKASLAADLKSRTTYPPLLLTNNITVDITLSPQAQRDTDLPDLGYHYEPLDYVVSGITLTNSTLTMTNGAAIGTYGAYPGYAIRIRKGGKLTSEGSPAALNHIARYNTVQEQANTNWSASGPGSSVLIAADSSPVPRGSFRFTDWSLLGGNGDHFRGAPEQISTPFAFMDCQFGPGYFYAFEYSVALTNCLLERVFTDLNDDDSRAYTNYVYNSLFHGGYLVLGSSASGTRVVKDNLFITTSLFQNGTLTHSNNAYVSGSNRFTPTNSNDVVLTNSPVFLTSTLGKFYYPTNDGMLSLLINAGSRYATNAALAHFTVTTNQIKDTSWVDIGWHVVAVTNGVPFDADGDSLADYFEDRNGNGTFNSSAGETDWNTYNSLYGLTGSPGLQVFTPLK